MKKNFFSLIATVVALSANAQLTPEYKVPMPDKLVLNHSCMYGNMQQLFQSIAGTSDPASAQFTNVTSDAAGNLYFTGYADFTVNPPTNPNYPYAAAPITFGSNTTTPVNQTRPAGHKFFVAKYTANGNAAWINFLTEEPKKLLWSEQDKKIYLTFIATWNGISMNGTMLPLDSNYQSDNKVILTLSDDGTYYNFYKNLYTSDFIIAGNKKILIYRRDFTSTSKDIRYGFFENNQVMKWIPTPDYLMYQVEKLHYNPYENAFWYLNNVGDKYYRLFIQTNPDTIIDEGVARNLNREVGIPIQNIKTIDKFHFLPNGFIGEYYTQIDIWGNSPQKKLSLVRVDANGNVVWRTKFSPQNNMWHKVLVDNNSDVWIDLPTTAYYDKCYAETAGKEYTLNPFGNVGVANNYLLKLEGATGDIKNAYINGYGNLNISQEISLYTNMQLLHITVDNRLITTPQIGAVAYYPDDAANFIPYYTTCSNELLPSQFMWVSFNLNDLKVFKREESEEEKMMQQSSVAARPQLIVYPNPSHGEFTVLTNRSEQLALYDITGKLLDTFVVNANNPFTYRHALPQGVYVLRGKESGGMKKMIVN